MSVDNGGTGLSDLTRLVEAQSRSISAENPKGGKGEGGRASDGTASHAARELGQGWKVSPYTHVPNGETITLAEIDGPGQITHIWLTIGAEWWRRLVVRVYWDGEDTPSIETPLGDFFCNGWAVPSRVTSEPIAVNPLGGFNSYWPMPFRESARITVENLWDEDSASLYYSVDYELRDIPDAAAYLHAQWRRSNPLEYKTDHTIVDGVSGRGHYVGTYIAWGSNNNGWWGEGEIKFFVDGDEDFPTICGTGTEDYFGGAWCFYEPRDNGELAYATFSTQYLGFPQAIPPTKGAVIASQARFGMYRWHIKDPVRFADDLRVTIQAIGWRSGGRYLPLQDDIASTAFWYQLEPHAAYPALPDRDGIEVV